jgi:hypothetical protein
MYNLSIFVSTVGNELFKVRHSKTSRAPDVHRRQATGVEQIVKFGATDSQNFASFLYCQEQFRGSGSSISNNAINLELSKFHIRTGR